MRRCRSKLGNGATSRARRKKREKRARGVDISWVAPGLPFHHFFNTGSMASTLASGVEVEKLTCLLYPGATNWHIVWVCPCW